MQTYHLSDRDARTLAQVVDSGSFKNPQDVLRHLVKTYAPNLVQPTLAIDPQLASNGAYMAQMKWIQAYNSQEGEFRGKRMLTSADALAAPELASQDALDVLQITCRKWLVTGTHNSYDPNILAGTVTHNYQSTVVTPKAISLDKIPVFEGVPLSKVVETSSGLLYVRALADDENATKSNLLKRHVSLSGKEPEDILYWTPTQRSRNVYPERAVGLVDDGGRFLVIGNDNLDFFVDDFGHSLRVLVSPRSGRAKK